MAETLKDYLVGINFKVDQAGAGKAKQSVSDLDAATQELGAVLMQAAAAFKALIAQMQGGKGATDQASDSMKKASSSAGAMDKAFRKAGDSGKLPGLKQGKRNVSELDTALKKATDTAKKYAKAAAAYFVGSNIKKTFEDVMKFNEELGASAKKLNKTVEQTRAYNLALQVMGKTAKDIEQSKTLKATFKDLQAIGNSLALPEAANGLRNIAAVKDSLMELKMVGNYALNWIYYKMQEVAAGPLKETRDMLGGLRKWFSGRIPQIAQGIAQAFSWVVQIFNSVASAIGFVLGLIDELPASVKIAGAAIIGVILAIKSKVALVTGIIGVVLLLIDDLVTHLQGGESLFGDFWDACIEKYNKVKPIIDKAIQTFDSLIQKVQKAWNESSGFGDFIKRLVMGEDYSPDETTWTDVGEKIWGFIVSGITKAVKGAGDWLKTALGYTPSDSWSSIGPAIWDKIKKGITIAAGKAGDWLKAALGYKASDSWKTVGSGIWDKIKTGITEVAGKAGDWLKQLLGYTPDDSWSVVGMGILLKIFAGIQRLGKAAGDWLKNILGYKPDDSWEDVGGEVFTNIQNGIKKAITNAGDWLATLFLGEDQASQLSTSEKWHALGMAIWNGILGGIPKKVDFLADLILGQDAIAQLEDQSTAGKLKAIGEVIWKALTDAFQAVGATLDDIFGTDSQFQELTTSLTGFAESIAEIVGKVSEVVSLKDAFWGIAGALAAIQGIKIAGSISGALVNIRKLLGGGATTGQAADAAGQAIGQAAAGATKGAWLSKIMSGLKNGASKAGTWIKSGAATLGTFLTNAGAAAAPVAGPLAFIFGTGALGAALDKAAVERDWGEFNANEAQMPELLNKASGKNKSILSDFMEASQAYDEGGGVEEIRNKFKKNANDLLELLPQMNFWKQIEDKFDLTDGLDEGEISNIIDPNKSDVMADQWLDLMKEVVNGISEMVKQSGEEISEVSSSADSTFSEIDSSASTHMDSAAQSAEDAAARMKAAFESLKGLDIFGFLGGFLPHAANGGIFSSPTKALIGEDGKEYVIPVTKPERALPLIMSALKDMGFTAQGYRNAMRSLGGSAYGSYTPSYAMRGIAANTTMNHNTNTVTAPATINVYGRDSKAIANQVSKNQVDLVLRNLKTAIL